MINKLFYQRKLLNVVTTTTTKLSIFRVLQKYFYRIYNVDHFLMIFKTLDMTLKNSNQSLYIEINIEVVVNLTENMIKKYFYFRSNNHFRVLSCTTKIVLTNTS